MKGMQDGRDGAGAPGDHMMWSEWTASASACAHSRPCTRIFAAWFMPGAASTVALLHSTFVLCGHVVLRVLRGCRGVLVPCRLEEQIRGDLRQEILKGSGGGGGGGGNGGKLHRRSSGIMLTGSSVVRGMHMGALPVADEGDGGRREMGDSARACHAVGRGRARGARLGTRRR